MPGLRVPRSPPRGIVGLPVIATPPCLDARGPPGLGLLLHRPAHRLRDRRVSIDRRRRPLLETPERLLLRALAGADQAEADLPVLAHIDDLDLERRTHLEAAAQISARLLAGFLVREESPRPR